MSIYFDVIKKWHWLHNMYMFFKCGVLYTGPIFQEKQARIASLYLPLYGLILDNMPRFFLRDLFPIYFTSSDQVRVNNKR